MSASTAKTPRAKRSHKTENLQLDGGPEGAFFVTVPHGFGLCLRLPSPSGVTRLAGQIVPFHVRLSPRTDHLAFFSIRNDGFEGRFGDWYASVISLGAMDPSHRRMPSRRDGKFIFEFVLCDTLGRVHVERRLTLSKQFSDALQATLEDQRQALRSFTRQTLDRDMANAMRSFDVESLDNAVASGLTGDFTH